MVYKNLSDFALHDLAVDRLVAHNPPRLPLGQQVLGRAASLTEPRAQVFQVLKPEYLGQHLTEILRTAMI